jgi:hypothetical protein
MAIFGALGLGSLFAGGLELLQARVRGRNHLTSVMAAQPIAVIPYIYSENDKRGPFPAFRPPSLGRGKRKGRKKGAAAPDIAPEPAL